ncbi:MAG: glycosyltransferase family 4 protein [Ilumatobacteraceae bacterium]
MRTSTSRDPDGSGRTLIYVRGWHLSGVTRWAASLKAGLADIGHPASLLVRTVVPGVAAPAADHDTLFEPAATAGRIATFQQMVRLCRRERPGHVHMVDGDIAVVLALAATRTPRSASIHVNPTSFRARLLVFLTAVLTRRLVLLTEHQHDVVARSCHLPRRWLHVVPNAVQAPAWVRWSVADQPVVGIVSRLVPRKGLEHLPDIATTLARDHGLLTVVHGDGPLRADLEACCSDCATFRGVKLDTDELYTDIDVLLILSPDEVGPTTALEAAVRGIPVVSLHQLPGVHHGLGDLALVPDRADPALVVAAIAAARDHNAWPSPAELHQHVAERFDRAVVARQFVAALRLEEAIS